MIKDQLDISIISASKFLTTEKKILDFLSVPVQIEHKTDGVKLTVIKKSDNGNIDDYIFSYKENILYKTEYDYASIDDIKCKSISASQFKLVFRHFSGLGKNTLTVGTELFIEFLMTKPTLSSNYTKKHKMVLLGYSESVWVEKFGKLRTAPGKFKTESRAEIARELKIDTPELLFTGFLGAAFSFVKGIRSKALLREFDRVKSSVQWDSPKDLIQDLRELFLSVDSRYGGKEEGVVIKFESHVIKWQQDYQLDSEARLRIKMKYREDDPELETSYWENVKKSAKAISSSVEVNSRSLEETLGDLSVRLKKEKPQFFNIKKSLINIKDDIQLNAKTLIIKRMRGNNNAIILGKFRVLTTDGHVKLIRRALSLYDDVVICLITGKDTKHTKELREKMLKVTFPGITVIHATNANLVRILPKSPLNINVVFAGTDRVLDYRTQLKHSAGVSVSELLRTSDDISASRVISEILSEDFFRENTPSEIHSMYPDIRSAYGEF